MNPCSLAKNGDEIIYFECTYTGSSRVLKARVYGQDADDKFVLRLTHVEDNMRLMFNSLQTTRLLLKSCANSIQ